MLENSGEISMMGLFMVTAGLATYGIATFGTKLHLQSKIKAMKEWKTDASSQQPDNIIRYAVDR